MKNIREIITIDNEIQNGQAVFGGTRVPVETLFEHLEAGVSLDDYLADFPSVKKELAIAVLEIARKILSARNLVKLYETAA
ncbi:hypothetical protein BH09BAC5_BH09BAC5_06060 [soil metagenome]